MEIDCIAVVRARLLVFIRRSLSRSNARSSLASGVARVDAGTMSLADLLGQTHAIETIRRGLARGKLHHALLLHGPDGVGKELCAFGIACALVCESAPGVGCGHCNACFRATTLSTNAPHTPLHPDVVLVERGLYPKETLGRTTEEKTELSVDQIRRVVLERVAYAPHEARARVVIVRRADEMSIGAANALLKTLEEPPLHTRFVLMTTTPGELLPTIRSRTQPIRFSPLADAVVATILTKDGMDSAQAKSLSALANGSMKTATSLADPEATATRAQAIASLRRGFDGPLTELLEASAAYGNGGEDRERLRRDLEALIAHEAAELRATMLASTTDDASMRARADAAVSRHAVATRVLSMLDRNANVPLALESGLLQARRRVV